LNSNLIAVCGKIRSGKDTFAKYLIENYGYKEFKFSAGISEIIEKYFPQAWANGKPRLHYQHIGQQLRVLDENVWVKYTLKQIEEYLSTNPDGKIIITDMRQANEAHVLRDHGYTLVKVEADTETRIKRMVEAGDQFTEQDLYHETEKQVDLIMPDYTVFNMGTLEQLHERTKELYGRLVEHGTTIKKT
jgi:dephospho-CoA kinase